jgi:ABC-2 type transport system ATP-binding protein
MLDSAALLELATVSRRLAGRNVVADLSLTLTAGEILGLLGVNGAGKSTTQAMIAGALAPSTGTVRVQGHDLAAAPDVARRAIGWLPERAPLWPELTVREHLDACGHLRGLRGPALAAARERVFERLDLGALSPRLAGVLSLGQRQRLGLACALLHAPPLLVLDEPANGLDPLQADALRALLREQAAAGTAIVLSTHVLTEVTAVCSRVAILHEGRLRHDAPLAATGDGLRVTLAAPADLTRITVLAPVARVEGEDAHRVRVTLREGADAAALARALVGAGLPLAGLEPAAAPLERIFFAIATQRAQAAA